MSPANGFLEGYLARRWRPVPVHRPDPDTGGCSCGKPDCPNVGKHPVARFWPGGAVDPADFAGRNVGVKLGPDSGNLADVDLDCGEAVAAGALLLPPTGAAFGRGGLLTHGLYTATDGAASFLKLSDPVLKGDQATIVELRWPTWDDERKEYKAFQTVLPPSLHSSGETLQWVRDGEPAGVPGAGLVAAVRHVGAAVLVARYARPAERHALVLLIANLLVRAGWADDAKVVAFMAAVFAARNDPEKVKKVTGGEGLGAVKDARQRHKKNQAMTGLPALQGMLDPALDDATARKVVGRVKEWLGVPDPPAAGAAPHGPPAWELPVPLPEVAPAPRFPVELFPAAVADYWAAKAEALHVPVDYVAGPALAVLGAAVGRSRAAEVKPGYAESPLFWIVNIAPPGATKSASLHGGRAPLDREESRWRKEHADAVQLFDAETARYEYELKEWKRNPEGADPPTKPRRPTLRQTVLDDTTAEAAAKVLKDNPRGAVLLKDELIGFGRMLNQYKGGKGNDKTFWLTGWNGKGVGKANRSKDHDAGPLVVIDPFTAVAGMMCPDSLPELREELQRGGPTQDGWCDRFLFQYPEPLDAVEETWAVVPEELETGYCQVVLDLLGLEMVPVEDPARETAYRPYFVRFDAAARSAWSAFTREIAARINSLPRTDNYRGVLSKLKHYGLRFACLFHCLDVVSDADAEKSTVTAACMDRAAAVVWYYEAHGRRCLGVGDRSTELTRRLLDVLRGWPAAQFTKRDLHRRVRGQSAFRRADQLDAPLVLLTQHGFVAATDGTVAPGRPAERYAINPLWDRTGGDEPPAGSPQAPPGPPAPGTDEPDCGGGVEAAPESAAGSFGHVSRVLSMPGRDGEQPLKTSGSAGFVHIVHARVEDSQTSRGGPDGGGSAEGGLRTSRKCAGDMDNMDKTREFPRNEGDFAPKPPHGQNPPDMDKTPGGSHPGAERRGDPQSTAVIGRRRGGRAPRSTGCAPAKGVPGLNRPPTVATDAAELATVTGVVTGWSGPVGLDTETTGLDPARDRVRLLQLAVGGDVFLIDLFAFPDPAAALAPLFAALAGKEVVGHNVTAFDLPFLARLGFAPNAPMFDTAVASRVMYAGEAADHDLAAVVRRELGRELDKGGQRSDWSAAALTRDQLAYAAADVAVLAPLAAALRQKAAARAVEAVLDLEARCALPVARMAARGVGFDAAPWIALADAAAERKRALVLEMNALAPNPACLPGLAGWNWDSNTADVPKAFAAVGVSLADTKEETLAGIDHPLAKALLEYREASKKANTYGRTWVEEHATGGRVYATWNPCQAKTGRMSCKRPNLQQVPRDAAYRRCFAARGGHVLVKCDFSQIELRIAAKVTGDTRMLAAYRKGEDLHALTAARFLGVGPGEVTREARQMAKPVNFGAIYGLGPRSLRLKARAEYGKNMTENEAKGFLDAFFQEFAGVRAWHNAIKRRKAVEVRTLGGRRVAVEPDQFYGAKANYVIQGTGGDGLKRALVLLWERRAECPAAEPVLAVHDEVVVEVPEADAEHAKAWLERCMVDAMAPLIDPVPVEVESKVGRTWGG